MARGRAQPATADAALVRAWMVENPTVEARVFVPTPGAAFVVALYLVGTRETRGWGAEPVATGMNKDIDKALLQAISEYETR